MFGEKEQQQAFEEIKSRLQKPPVLSMPNRKDRFLLYSATSKLATGSTLYQFQDEKPKLIAYMSKRMPEATKNYSITELEMCGLVINISPFSHLLRKVYFDTVVDHLAIMHIMKSPVQPATNRIKRLLEVLSSYFFNLYYIKGKDMILSDFLSRQQGDISGLHQIIPISFNMKEIFNRNYQNAVKDTFMVQTQSQTKSKGVKTPAVQKASTPSNKREKEIKPIVIDDTPTVIDLDDTPDIDDQSQNTKTKLPWNLTRPGVSQTTYSQPLMRPPSRSPDPNNRRNHRTDTGIDPNLDFEENSPHQEGIITEIYVSSDQSYIEHPQELADLVDSTKLVKKYLPKQVDINKILEIIKRKVRKGIHLPLTFKKIQAGYLNSPFFKDLDRYLAQNKLPSKRSAMCKVLALSQNYILLDSLPFKLITVLNKET